MTALQPSSSSCWPDCSPAAAAVPGRPAYEPPKRRADDVAEYQPRWRSHTVDSTQYRKVFLAGTIDMGRSADWQAALVARFRDSIGGRWLFFNPRRREFHASPAEMEYQVAWELAHLERPTSS